MEEIFKAKPTCAVGPEGRHELDLSNVSVALLRSKFARHCASLFGFCVLLDNEGRESHEERSLDAYRSK